MKKKLIFGVVVFFLFFFLLFVFELFGFFGVDNFFRFFVAELNKVHLPQSTTVVADVDDF